MTILQLRQELVVQKRLAKEANEKGREFETALFALQQDYAAEEMTRKRVESDLLARDRSLTEAEDNLNRAEDDLRKAEADLEKY